MARKRMFLKSFVGSDLFLDMPLSAQALYFHLAVEGDDDGFVDNPKTIVRKISASSDDMKILIAKGFVIPFDSGVVVIAHWKLHNTIGTDRYKKTMYIDELSKLELASNKMYVLIGQNDVIAQTTMCTQNVNKMEPQIRTDKYSEVSVEEGNTEKSAVEEFFEKIWMQYPKPIGKSKVFFERKKQIFLLGEEKINAALSRYAESVKGLDPKFIQHGSTFFNGGYEDYLDENFCAISSLSASVKTKIAVDNEPGILDGVFGMEETDGEN